MKKATFLAAAMMMGVVVAASPLQAMAAGPQRSFTNKNVVKVISTGNLTTAKDALKDYIKNCGEGNVHVITIPCIPGGNMPDINVPGTGTPECPETNQPETNQPGTNQPETDQPSTNQPETDQPGTNQPGTNQPEAEQPGTNQPGTNQPETDQPETEQPGEEDFEQSVHEYVLRIVELVNEEREKAGLNALTLKEDITEAAQVRAVESETLFSHTRPDGTSFVTALKEAGVSYRGAGENIAWGQKSPEEVMKGWMNSAGHRANILNEKYTSIGVGYYQNAKGVNYWSQLFTY